jgi:hypothetical protein
MLHQNSTVLIEQAQCSDMKPTAREAGRRFLTSAGRPSGIALSQSMPPQPA